METYFVDDGGDNSTGAAWATAYTSVQALVTAQTLASGDLVYIGADSNCTDAAAALVIVGPAAGAPVYLISSTVGAGTTVSYSVGTGDQILATGGTSDVTFDGSFALYGIRAKAGRNILFTADLDETAFTEDCKLLPGPNGIVGTVNSTGGRFHGINLTVDCVADTADSSSAPIFPQGTGGRTEISGLTLVNCTDRTNTIAAVSGYGQKISINGISALDWTHVNAEIAPSATGVDVVLSNIRSPATFTPFISTVATDPAVTAMIANCGPADDPAYLAFRNYYGQIVAATPLTAASVYRTGGAEIEGSATAWLVTTTAACSEGSPFYTPWMYGLVGSTGSKTFDVFITNDTGDFDDSQVWLEVQYLGTADEADWALASDHRVITATAAAQDDDTTSTWTGGASGFDTYKQRLRVTATVNETGQFRARVVVGLASIASTRDFYVDPKVVVA